MNWYKETLQVRTHGKGLVPITQVVESCIQEWGIREGLCTLFVQHTSASLVISESYDPTARIDLEAFMERIAPQDQSWYRHILEGSDDSPSHIRAMLTDTSLNIPIDQGKLSLGSWQGIYLFEHRDRGHSRKVLLRCLGVDH